MQPPLWPFWCDESSFRSHNLSTEPTPLLAIGIVFGACLAAMAPLFIDKAHVLGFAGFSASWFLFIASWLMWDPNATYNEHLARMIVYGAGFLVSAVASIPCAWAVVLYFIPPMHATNHSDKRDCEGTKGHDEGGPHILRYLDTWLPPDLHIKDRRHIAVWLVTWNVFGAVMLFFASLNLVQLCFSRGPCDPAKRTDILVISFNDTTTLWPPDSPPTNASLATSEGCIHAPLPPFDLEFFIELLRPFLVFTSIIAIFHADLHRPPDLCVQRRLGRVIPALVFVALLSFVCATAHFLLASPPLTTLTAFFISLWATGGAGLFIRLAIDHAAASPLASKPKPAPVF